MEIKDNEVIKRKREILKVNAIKEIYNKIIKKKSLKTYKL